MMGLVLHFESEGFGTSIENKIRTEKNWMKSRENQNSVGITVLKTACWHAGNGS